MGACLNKPRAGGGGADPEAAAASFGLGARYRVLRRLARGGQAEVWLAAEAEAVAPERGAPGGGDGCPAPGPPAGGRLVALKLFPRAALRASPDAARALREEALCQRACGAPPAVLPLRAVLLTRSHVALVLPYVPGGTLHAYARRARRSRGHPSGGCDEETRLLFRSARTDGRRGVACPRPDTNSRARVAFHAPRRCAVLLAALAHVHARGCAFRDVKPANALLTRSSPPLLVLCDFGCARRFGAGPPLFRTVVGTPGYIGPQALAEICAARADLAAGGWGADGCETATSVSSDAAATLPGSAADADASPPPPYDGVKEDSWGAGVCLYALLRGHLLFGFEEDVRRQGVAAALVDAWRRERRPRVGAWRDGDEASGRGGCGGDGGCGGCEPAPPLPPALCDLLDGLLNPDEGARPSARAALAHPWVAAPLPPRLEAAWAAWLAPLARADDGVDGRRAGENGGGGGAATPAAPAAAGPPSPSPPSAQQLQQRAQGAWLPPPPGARAVAGARAAAAAAAALDGLLGEAARPSLQGWLPSWCCCRRDDVPREVRFDGGGGGGDDWLGGCGGGADPAGLS